MTPVGFPVYLIDMNGTGYPSWPEVFAHIIQGRTPALGHVQTVAGVTNVDMNARTSIFDFTDSNYDHSAQFMSTNVRRQVYWKTLLDQMNLLP